MKIKTVVTLKDGTVYTDKDFDKEKSVKWVEEIGRLLNDDLLDSIVITKSIFTKVIKEKYSDAFEEAIESVKAFFSEENNDTVAKEAEDFFGAEMLKLKLEQEEKGREDDREWYRRKIHKLEENLTKMEEDRDSLFVKLTEAEDIIHELKEENACLLEQNHSILSSKLYVENMSLKNRLKEETEERDLLFTMNIGSQNEIEQLRDCNRKLKEENEMLYEENTILGNRIDILMDENTGKDSKIKALQLFLTNTNELVDTMSREIARLNQVIREDSYLVDSYKAKFATLNKEIDVIKNRAREIVRAYHQKYEEKEAGYIRDIEYHKEMEHIYESTVARKQKTFEKNYSTLLLELNSLKNRSLWQRIRNKH